MRSVGGEGADGGSIDAGVLRETFFWQGQTGLDPGKGAKVVGPAFAFFMFFAQLASRFASVRQRMRMDRPVSPCGSPNTVDGVLGVVGVPGNTSRAAVAAA